ncbi:MAG: glycosyltransferase family 1 protein, partial [Bacteroidota bacterium]
KGWFYNDIFNSVIDLDLKKRIIFTGYVSEEEMLYLYNCAELFVYPSFYEGFGLPPLEAMACGVPVITSNTSSLPEVVGDAGVLINPYDIDQLSEAIKVVLKDENLRKDLSAKGFERKKSFEWDKTVATVFKYYDELLLEARR